MESLIRQTRVRFSGARRENREEVGRDRRIRPQKTESFKGEKKRTQNWFQRQFSRQMSEDYDSRNGIEYAAGVAATAYAINSLEELSIAEQKKMREQPDAAVTKIKSRTETTGRVSEAGKISRRFSGDPSMAYSDAPDKSTSGKTPDKTVTPTASIKKTPTFADKQLSRTGSKKPESALPKTDLPSTTQPALPQQEIRRQSFKKAEIEETEADAWEKAEIAKIKERYNKLNTTILDWENKKKAKAKHRKERTESELKQRETKAMQHYQSEIARIDEIARGARAQADENRRNEEFKVKEKANKIRSTGKMPATCFCF